MSRAKSKPRCRADFARQVRDVKSAAAQAGLVELLQGIASDPDAGAWAPWAKKLMRGDGHGSKPPETGREK